MAPLGTIIATVTLIRGKRKGQMARPTKVLAWIAIAVSLIVNAFMLLGLWAATY